jgi:hypothetical protein
VRTDRGVDKGKIRTIANYLGKSGWPKDGSFAAMVKLCYKYEDQTILEYNPSPTEDDVLEYCEQNVSVLESFECCNNVKVKSVIPPSNAAFIHFMGGKVSGLPKEAAAFITVIRNGEMRYAGDPAFIYRDTILKAKARAGGRLSRNTILHLGIKAFNHAIKRTKISSRHLSIPTGRFLWSRPATQGNSVVLEKFLTREVL